MYFYDVRWLEAGQFDVGGYRMDRRVWLEEERYCQLLSHKKQPADPGAKGLR
jgi:hypothetical protein